MFKIVSIKILFSLFFNYDDKCTTASNTTTTPSIISFIINTITPTKNTPLSTRTQTESFP